MTPQLTCPPLERGNGAQSPTFAPGDAVLVLRRPTTDFEGRVVRADAEWVEVRFWDGWSRVYHPPEVTRADKSYEWLRRLGEQVAIAEEALEARDA